MKPFQVTSFRSAEPKALQLAARELGHGARSWPERELARIRRELSFIAEEAAPGYQRGFLDAINHLLAGVSAEAKHRRHLDEDVKAAQLRKNAAKVLLALHRGCERPKQIVEETGLSAPAVSSELADLEREQLVERLEHAVGADLRTSPRALTIRGMRVAEELVRGTVSATAEAARDLAPIFVAFMNRLADESYLAPIRLEEIAAKYLGPVNGAFVCDEFLKHAHQQRIISSTNSAITQTTAHYWRWLSDVLRSSLTAPEPPLVLEQMKQLAGASNVCLRATSAMRDLWQMALSFHGLRNVHPWCLDDARAEQLPFPDGDYHVVWENPEVMTHDLDDSELRPHLDKAIRRHCYVDSNVSLPDGVERIELDARLGAG